MKDAQPSIKAELGAAAEGASILHHFSFPPKLDAVCSEVLCRLLCGERLTSLDAVGEASTTRLSAHVFYLEDCYGWHIERTEKAAGCKDGRVAYVTEYFLTASVITHAKEQGACTWCDKVKVARLKLRTNAAEAKRQAELANSAAAKRRHAGEQRALFEGYTT